MPWEVSDRGVGEAAGYIDIDISPAAPRSRPQVREARPDGEPPVYQEIPSFPSFSTPISSHVSIEEICIRYPNHLRGSVLDAFIQYRWTSNDIYKRLAIQALAEFKQYGVTTAKRFSNRANFIGKRLEARLSKLSAEHVTALCTGPKIRPCMMDGGVVYGASKLQGKFHNPDAQLIRKFPERRRTPGLPFAAQLLAKGRGSKKSVLWGSQAEFEHFVRTMARHWHKYIDLGETIIRRDAVVFDCPDEDQKRMILQMACWPVDSRTETFFSFLQVQDCPAFVTMVYEGVEELARDFVQPEMAGVVDDTRRPLDPASARQAAESWILATQEARLAVLYALAFGPLAPEMMYGLVEQAVSSVTQVTADEISLQLEPDEPFFSTQHASFGAAAEAQFDASARPPAPVLKRAREEDSDEIGLTKRVKFEELPASDPRLVADGSEGDVHFFSNNSLLARQSSDMPVDLQPEAEVGISRFDNSGRVDWSGNHDFSTLALPQESSGLFQVYEYPAATNEPRLEDNIGMAEGSQFFGVEGSPFDMQLPMVDEVFMSEFPNAPTHGGHFGQQSTFAANPTISRLPRSQRLPVLGNSDPQWLKEVIEEAVSKAVFSAFTVDE